MANQKKNLTLRKQINDVMYDLMVKTITDQVYTSNDTKTLTTVLSEIQASIASKAEGAKLTELETKFNNLINDAPEAYDTLVEISNYISSHKTEYEALLAISDKKVDKVEGKQLSTEDFTTELKAKLEALYDKATLDQKFTEVTNRLDSLEGGVVSPDGITAEMVKYTKPGTEEPSNVKAILDDLLYVAVDITSFTSSAPVQNEIGTTIENLTLTWKTNKDITKQSINGNNIPDAAQRQYVESTPVTANKSWTLKVEDGKTTKSKTWSVSFLPKIYYGVAPKKNTSEINNEFILGLTGSKLAGSKGAVGTISVNAPADNYIYYAQPSSWPDPVFNIGGFDTEFELAHTFELTNASGHAQSYKVFKSGQAGLGSTSMAVK